MNELSLVVVVGPLGIGFPSIRFQHFFEWLSTRDLHLEFIMKSPNPFGALAPTLPLLFPYLGFLLAHVVEALDLFLKIDCFLLVLFFSCIHSCLLITSNHLNVVPYCEALKNPLSKLPKSHYLSLIISSFGKQVAT
jgi:hypothetical protein